MITKRTFLTALGCDTAGWYAAHALSEPPGPGLQWRFHSGAEIGRLAREQLGPGLLLPFAPTNTAWSATAEAIANPELSLLFEATFVSGSFVARADALRRHDHGWELLEVKSALTPESGQPAEDHLDDLAYTTFVAIAAGVAVARCTLVYLGRESRRGVFQITELDVTEAVLPRAAAFAARAPGIAAACAAVDRPVPTLQFICRKCDFFATECLGKDVPDPLFLLPRLSEKRFDNLKEYQRLSAVPAGPDLTAPQHRVFNAVRSGEPFVDQAVLSRLHQLVWPVYYLDFEAVQPALPWFDGCPPYEVIPFQFSIHVSDRLGHETAHHEYLAPIGADWREELAGALIEQLGQSGSIIVYSSYEKQRLTAMADTLPHFATQLHAIIARLVDLEPVVRNGYCHPSFLGRSSIKYVLPVVAPDLSYTTLDVSNGEDAAGLFALMTVGQHDPEHHAAHREHLLTYCKLDTLAMMRLHMALAAQLSGPAISI